jgi:hypothetical protein
VSVDLPTERPLYRRPSATVLGSDQPARGSDDFETQALADQVFVDRAELARRVFDRLGPREQVGLQAVITDAPLEHGLAELIGYLSLGDAGLAVVFDDEHPEAISWASGDDERVAEMPRATFSRQRTERP